MSSKCEHCKCPIVWVTGPRGGRMPVDAVPHDEGTVLIHRAVVHGTEELYGGTVTRLQAQGMRAAGKELHRPHRVSCVHADRWAKGKDREPRYRSRR